MAWSIVGYVVCHNAPREFVSVRHHLVAELVVVGDKVAVGAAEEFVAVAVAAGDVAHSTILERETWLQGSTERRELRFAHRGVALHHPQRHKYQSDGGTLLTQQITQEFDEAHIEVVVLRRVAVLVRHQLLEPRHRVALDGGRGEELHTLGQPHYQSVGVHILGVDDKWDIERRQFESVVDVGAHLPCEVERRETYLVGAFGVDYARLLTLRLSPLEACGVCSPTVILGKRCHDTHHKEERQCHKLYLYALSHLSIRQPFCSGNQPW